MGTIHRNHTCYLHSFQACWFSTTFWTLLHLVRTNSRFEVWIQTLAMETNLLPLELPWFGEMPGYYNTHQGGPTYPPSAGMTPGYGYGYPYHPPMSAPGHSIVIQPGINGAPPIVTQTQWEARTYIPPGVRNKWKWYANEKRSISCVLREANLPCQHLTSRNTSCSLTWASCTVHISTDKIFLIGLFCYLSSCPWRSSKIILCDGLLQVIHFYKWTLFGF